MTDGLRAVPDPIVVRRQNELFDLYNSWPGGGDPDDDPDFVAQAREIMGLPPLEGAPTVVRAGHPSTNGAVVSRAAELSPLF